MSRRRSQRTGPAGETGAAGRRSVRRRSAACQGSSRIEVGEQGLVDRIIDYWPEPYDPPPGENISSSGGSALAVAGDPLMCNLRVAYSRLVVQLWSCRYEVGEGSVR